MAEATEFFKLSRDGSKALIAQRCSNRSGRYLVVEVYNGGSRRGSIVVPERREGRGWRNFAVEL